MKKSATVAALVTTAILAGHTVSAQVAQPQPLGNVPVPKPANLGDYVSDETAAIALGKTLFWDMQLGSDGIQSCASCHFHAGADNRSKNQINPGSGNVFDIGGHANYQLTAGDFPFKTNDVAGSQGVFRKEFVDVALGSDKDNVNPLSWKILGERKVGGISAKSWGVFRGGVSPPPPNLFKTEMGFPHLPPSESRQPHPNFSAEG